MAARSVLAGASIALAVASGCGTSTAGVCASDRDCPGGYVCNLQSECVTVAAPPPDAGPPPPDAGGSQCTPQTFTLPAAPAVVQLVLDQSGTMNRDFGDSDRFGAMRDALVEPGAGVVARLENQVSFGVTLYTAHNGGATCPILQSVPRQLGNSAAIAALLDGNQPDADNPLAETLDRVLSDFAADPPAAGSTRTVIVATDGVADSCIDSDDGSGADASVEAATAIADAGIELHMISIASGVEASYLQRMANAGAGIASSDRVSAPFFVANSQSTLVDSFDRIVRNARCRLDARAIGQQLATTALSLDGRALATTEWEALDDGTIALLGGACEAFASTQPAVTATVACE